MKAWLKSIITSKILKHEKLIIGILLCLDSVQLLYAQANLPNSAVKSTTKEKQEILNLSNSKWKWMSDKNVDSLSRVFDEKCVFVPMGGSWGKTQELKVIKGGGDLV